MKVAPAVTFEVDTGVRAGRRRSRRCCARIAPRGGRVGGGQPRGRAMRSRRCDDETAATEPVRQGRRRDRRRRAGGRQADRASRRSTWCGRCAARRGVAARRARRDARPAGLGRAADLPRRGDQARAVPARRRQGVRRHGLLRRRDRHRRRGRARSPRAATRGAVDEAAVRRALALPRPHHARCRRLLGAQAGRAAALRLRARGRGGRRRAPRRCVVHELELVVVRRPEAVACAMRCSKGTYVRALARDWAGARGGGATSPPCAARVRGRSRWRRPARCD